MKSLLYSIGIFFVAILIVPFSAFATTTLTVFEWEGYISPFEEEFEAYAKRKGFDVDLKFLPNFITSPEEVFETARRGQADIVTPTNNYFKAEDGKLFRVLAPLDLGLLTNYDKIVPDLAYVDFDKHNKQVYSVPLIGGIYGLAYNANRVEEPVSWDILWDPASKGKFTLTKQQFSANLYMVLNLLGVPPEQFYQIDHNPYFDPVATQKRLDALIANAGDPWLGLAGNFGDGFDVERLDQFSYMATYGMSVQMANAAGKNWRMASPKEGQTMWVDTMSIARHTANDPTKKWAAYLLLDFMISKEIQQKLSDLYKVTMVHTDILAQTGDQDFYASTQYLWQPLPRRTRNFYRLMWDRAVTKAGKNW